MVIFTVHNYFGMKNDVEADNEELILAWVISEMFYGENENKLNRAPDTQLLRRRV